MGENREKVGNSRDGLGSEHTRTRQTRTVFTQSSSTHRRTRVPALLDRVFNDHPLARVCSLIPSSLRTNTLESVHSYARLRTRMLESAYSGVLKQQDTLLQVVALPLGESVEVVT